MTISQTFVVCLHFEMLKDAHFLDRGEDPQASL
jgi:hypothetical protein